VDDAARDEIRRTIAARGLTPTAAAYLTRDALGRIDLEQLAPVKGLLKRYFSDAPWTTEDADELAARVGPGEGWWRHELDGGIGLAFGWRDGAFQLEVERPETTTASAPAKDLTAPGLDDAFDSAIVPEATPNPRTIRFVTGHIHDGASRWYESATDVDDPRVARVFDAFDDVANVLVGPDFVAVGIRRPDHWEQLLGPMLHVLEAEFPAEPATDANAADRAPTTTGPAPTDTSTPPPTSAPDRAFDRAWRDLRALHLERPEDLEQLLAAASSDDVASRQVAARVLLDADTQLALTAWDALVTDSSRTVRRATVDAMVDAARPEVRPLLERALGDRDAWTRWKALRGLVDLGIEPSRTAAALLAADTDFRVRLEAVRALRDQSDRSLRE
jgi:hypothetical protein